MTRPYLYTATAIIAMLAASAPAHAAANRIVKQDGYTLVFRDLTTKADQHLADHMIDTFFATYPRMAAAFNPAAPHKVIFDLDPAYTVIANTRRNHVQFNPDWFVRHPTDIDMEVHEAMHVVQAYGNRDEPGWLVEGVADYARNTYGLDNEHAGWGLPVPGPDTNYKQGYRAVARFLIWAEKDGHPGLVKALDAKMRTGQYRDSDWQALTGNSLDQLWAAYIADQTKPLHIIVEHPLTPEMIAKAKALIAQMEADKTANADPSAAQKPPPPPAPQ